MMQCSFLTDRSQLNLAAKIVAGTTLEINDAEELARLMSIRVPQTCVIALKFAPPDDIPQGAVQKSKQCLRAAY